MLWCGWDPTDILMVWVGSKCTKHQVMTVSKNTPQAMYESTGYSTVCAGYTWSLRTTVVVHTVYTVCTDYTWSPPTTVVVHTVYTVCAGYTWSPSRVPTRLYIVYIHCLPTYTSPPVCLTLPTSTVYTAHLYYNPPILRHQFPVRIRVETRESVCRETCGR
jgi:hypothetical protein